MGLHNCAAPDLRFCAQVNHLAVKMVYHRVMLTVLRAGH